VQIAAIKEITKALEEINWTLKAVLKELKDLNIKRQG